MSAERRASRLLSASCVVAFVMTLACGAANTGGASAGPEILYDLGTARAGAIEADAQFLYWAAAGPFRIVRVSKSGGGQLEEIGPWSGTEITESMFAVDDTAVYWLDDTVVRRRNKGDGALSTIELGRPPVEGGWFMAADSDYLL